VAAAGALAIHVNDKPRALAGSGTVLALIRELGLEGRKGVAVAVNGGVVPRSAWPVQALADGDRVLVIQATQGG
jgi:sulfur carrier protein